MSSTIIRLIVGVTFLGCMSYPSVAQDRPPRITDRDAIDPDFTQHTLVSSSGDTEPDLWQVLKFGGGVGPKLEVHALSGSSEYKQYIMQSNTDRDAGNPAVVARDDIMYDWDRDGVLDLVEVNKFGGGIGPKVQIHVLSGAKDPISNKHFHRYLYHGITDRDAGPPHEIVTEHFITDWNRDGRPDLVQLLKFGGGIGRKIQIHILSGAPNSEFKKYLLQTETDRDAGPPNVIVTDHAFLDWDGDGKPDLIEFLKSGGGVGDKVQVHVLSGAGAPGSEFKKYILQRPLPNEVEKDAKSALNTEYRAGKARVKV
jgi:hypothetical protein